MPGTITENPLDRPPPPLGTPRHPDAPPGDEDPRDALIRRLRGEVVTQRRRADALEGDLALATGAVDEARAELARKRSVYQREMAQLEGRLHDEQAARRTVAATATARSREVRELQGEVDALRLQRRQLWDEVAELKAKLPHEPAPALKLDPLAPPPNRRVVIACQGEEDGDV